MRSRSPSQRDEHVWVVVDHELLSRLGEHSSRAEWERTLRRTGLWDLEGLEGAEGKDLAEVRAALTAGMLAEASPPTHLVTLTAEHLRAAASIVGVLAGVAFVVGAPGYMLVATFVAIGLAVASRVVPEHAPLADAPVAWPAERATRALRRFLSHSFVAAAGDRIVENTPHRAYLELRLEEVDRALRVVEGRIEELREVRTRVAQANVRIGRPAEDVETARLTAAIKEKEATRERVAGVRALLSERLVDLERQLERLRLVVERRALSERVSRLTDTDARRDPVEQVAAEVEVDVAEIEGRVRALALETGDADARLRAVLEVVRPADRA